MQRTIFRGLILLLAALGAVGCAKYQPAPLDPRLELLALRSKTVDGIIVQRIRPGEQAAPTSRTFDPSDGLDEAEVVSVALTLNPDLRAKRLEIGQAQALLISAGLWPNPEIGVGLKFGVAGASGYNLDADALFQLLRPGERSARKAAAQARVAEVDADIVAEEFATVAEVRTQRVQVLVAEQAVKLFDEELNLRQRARDLVRRQRQLGDASELEVSTADLELAEVRRDQRKAETALGAERLELNRLLGLPPEYVLRLTESGQPLKISVFADVSDEELDQRVMSGRLELRAAEAAYRRSDQELRLAIQGQYPRIGVGPAFERELEGDSAFGPALSLELPLLNRNQAEVAAARSERDQRRAQYSALLHRLRSQAFAARAALQRARFEVETQEKEVLPLVERNQQLFEGAFGRRDVNIFDWITAQQRAVRSRREYLESLERYRAAATAFESATGMLLSNPVPPPATAPTTEPSSEAKSASPLSILRLGRQEEARKSS